LATTFSLQPRKHESRTANTENHWQAFFFSLALGSLIGRGWLTRITGWLSNAGPVGALAAFALGGTLILAIGYCYARVMEMLPVSGGQVGYA
jgi:amino acid permease